MLLLKLWLSFSISITSTTRQGFARVLILIQRFSALQIDATFECVLPVRVTSPSNEVTQHKQPTDLDLNSGDHTFNFLITVIIWVGHIKLLRDHFRQVFAIRRL
jgi:hypothetical protein